MLERWLKPRTEHPDAQIRLEAFKEIDPGQDIFIEAVQADADPAVRASLLSRLCDTTLLIQRAQNDSDSGCTQAAGKRLTELLGGNVEEAPAIDQRLAVIAELSLADVLRGVCASGREADIREAAMHRHVELAPTDRSIVVAVAAEDADTQLRHQTLAAIESLDELEAVAAQARKSHKDTHKAAREKIKAIRDAQQRAIDRDRLCSEIQALADEALPAQNESWHQRQGQLQLWLEAWAAAQGETAGPALSAVARIEQTISDARRIATQRSDLLAALAEASADGEAQEPQWRSQWQAIPDHSDAQQREFEKALAAFNARKKVVQRRSGAESQAAILLAEWADFNVEKTPVTAKMVASLEKNWRSIALPDDADETLAARYGALHDSLVAASERRALALRKAGDESLKLAAELAEHLAAGRSSEATSAYDKLKHRLGKRDHMAQSDSVKIKQKLTELEPQLRKLKDWRSWGVDQARTALCDEADALQAAAADIAPAKLANRVKAMRLKWQELDKGVGPAAQSLWQRFDKACEQAYAPAKIHFDEQSKQRKENAAKKRAVCETLENFARDADWEAPDWRAAAKVLDDARKAWRDVGDVNNKQFEKLRDRYRRAVAAIDDKLAGERQSEIDRRTRAIEALKKSIENDPLAVQIEAAKKTQREWRPSVQGRRKQEQQMWEALRELCDAIFASRDEASASRREAQSETLTTRHALCDEVAALLTDDAPDDAAVSLANARFDEIKKLWRDAGDVPMNKKPALQKRFRDVSSDFETRRERVARHARSRQTESLFKRALLLDEIGQRLHEGGDVDELRTQFESTPAVRGALAKSQQSLFAKLTGDKPQPADADAATKKDLCLRLELLADVPSPDAYQADRMALKIALLKDAMAGTTQAGGDLPSLLTAWASSGPVERDEWQALRQRFENAATALIGSH